MIIAAHCGTGKTTLAKKYPDKFIDFFSMPFKYYLPHENGGHENGGDEDKDKYDESKSESCKADFDLDMREDFPENYITAIKENMGNGKTLLIPPIVSVLNALEEAGIDYIIVYPVRSAKEEYRERFVKRGNNEDFIWIFVERWDYWLDALEADTYGKKIILEPHEFLEEALKREGFL